MISEFFYPMFLGNSIDWALGTLGILYSYIIELPPTTHQANGPCTFGGYNGGSGFALNESDILEVGKEQHAGLLAILKHLMREDKMNQIDM